ncbi:hypothetical protein [Noviherbaspirillum sp. Root189]|uniref:hypothetical protein n=1 Tax=Noviherbaspirillum sp. Root189 TaxID=1736487 RepID=UPI0012E39FD9|nr:hypothetical protein [Noviherbaspirillum sp. Root189]
MLKIKVVLVFLPTASSGGCGLFNEDAGSLVELHGVACYRNERGYIPAPAGLLL